MQPAIDGVGEATPMDIDSIEKHKNIAQERDMEAMPNSCIAKVTADRHSVWRFLSAHADAFKPFLASKVFY